MSRRDPKRLRLVAGSALQRRVLDSAAHEEPSPEVRDRMARALGVSAAAISAASGAAVAKTAVAATKAAVGVSASTTSVLPWITVGVLGLAVAGAIVGTRAWQTQGRPSPASHAATSVSKPTTGAESAPSGLAPAMKPASPAALSARSDAPSLPLGHRTRASAPPIDLREQTSLVDAARDAVSAGAPDKALALLRQYQDRYPAGVFRPEAAALRIEALTNLGRSTEAHSLAERFAAEYGEGPLTDRVRRVSGLAHP